jgi:hypothetical protein
MVAALARSLGTEKSLEFVLKREVRELRRIKEVNLAPEGGEIEVSSASGDFAIFFSLRMLNVCITPFESRPITIALEGEGEVSLHEEGGEGFLRFEGGVFRFGEDVRTNDEEKSGMARSDMGGVV